MCFLSKNFELQAATLPLTPKGLTRMCSEIRNLKDPRLGLVLKNRHLLDLRQNLCINEVAAFPGTKSSLRYSEIEK